MISIRWTTVALQDFEIISYRIEQDRDLGTANRICRTVYEGTQMLRVTFPAVCREMKKEPASLWFHKRPTSLFIGSQNPEKSRSFISGTALKTGSKRPGITVDYVHR